MKKTILEQIPILDLYQSNITIEYNNINFACPYQTNYNKVYNDLFFTNNIIEFIFKNWDDVLLYPIWLSCVKNINCLYPLLINHLVDLYLKELVDDNSIYTFLSLTPNSLSAIIRNKYIDNELKRMLIYTLFHKLAERCNYEVLASTLIYHLYEYPLRTLVNVYDHIPLYIIKLFFQQLDLSKLSSGYTDSFIQYLTEDELDEVMPLLIKKDCFYELTNNANKYIWYVTRAAKYMPYIFTEKKILPLFDPDNMLVCRAILTMTNLKQEDRDKLYSRVLLEDLR